MTHTPPRGFTLVEMVLVIVLAGVVTLGLIGFYLNSQATWMDASAQVLAQRDATTILETISAKAREAKQVIITPNYPDTILTFVDGANQPYSFWWKQGPGADSLIHCGDGTGNVDDGPVAPTKVERFFFEPDPVLPIVHVRMLEMRTSQGEDVQMSTSFALYNGPRP